MIFMLTVINSYFYIYFHVKVFTMRFIILTLNTIFISFILLVGCSTNNKFNQLSSNYKSLNDKTKQITNDISKLRSDIKDAKDDAHRANQRLDNQVMNYHK